MLLNLLIGLTTFFKILSKLKHAKMNLKKMNLVELNAQESAELEGGNILQDAANFILDLFGWGNQRWT